MEVVYDNLQNRIRINKYTTNFGQKLSIRAPYNEHFISVIKSTDWNKTHRTYKNDSKEWEIDYSRMSISEIVEKCSGCQEPICITFVPILDRLLENFNTTAIVEQPQQRQDDKFINIELESKDIIVDDAYILDTRRTGIEYHINMTINKQFDNLPNPLKVMGIFSRKMSNRSSKKYGRGVANPINMLADFLRIEHREFETMLESPDSKNTITQLLQAEGSRIMKIGATKVVQEGNNGTQLPPVYRIFNLSTEIDVIVTFTEIRSIIKNEIGIDVTEEKVGGSIIWKCNTFTEVENGETLVGQVLMSSGNNLKRSSMKVLGEIKIGSCDNSLVPYENVHIRHTTNWKERFVNAVKECVESLKNAIVVIRKAMTETVSIGYALAYVDTCDFGLQKVEKIIAIRTLIKERIKYEFRSGNDTLWSMSQAFTYIGSHENTDKNDITDATLTTLKKKGFEILKGDI